jgi:hypothetical protein
MFERFKSAIKTPTVEFLCLEEDLDVIPAPYPARKLMPEWYKNLAPRIDGKNTLVNGTVKRCAPFLDAMSIGWIIPLAGDVQFVTNEDASGVTYQWTFHRSLVENHNRGQVEGHPELPKPPMKFLNYWLIKVPKDYSLLFIPPLNRPNEHFECVSGLVDADNYLEFINFPFFFKKPNFTGIIKQGTPLVQVIPIHRSMLTREFEVGVIDEATQKEVSLVRRKRSAHESYYRDSAWVRK